MHAQVERTLRPVQARQRRQSVVRGAVAGLLLAALAGCALGAARLAADAAVPYAVTAGLLLAGPVLGGLVGGLIPRTRHAAAAAIDAHYGLKDRATTALVFSREAAPSTLQSMQVTEAMDHLNRVVPSAVVPRTAPRYWQEALSATAVAVALLVWPSQPAAVNAGPAPAPEVVLGIAAERKAALPELEKKLAEHLNDLDDETSEQDKKAIKELIEKAEKKLDEMTENGMTEREALAKLSELTAENQSLLDQLNVAAMDGQMSSLGQALASAQAFEGAGKALQEGKLEKAVKELEKLDDNLTLTPKEAKDAAQKLEQFAKKMGEAGQGSMSNAAGELAESLKSGDGKDGNVGKAAKNLAKRINNAVKRKKIADLLNAENEELKECKGNCQMNGGARKKQLTRSKDPSSTWGRGISGNEGERTKLASRRNEMQLTGEAGQEGDSEVEKTNTPEARQTASREYKERHQKFKKESESVIEGEPIPLGHRQTVKKYFELIRPSTEDAFNKDKTTPAAPAAPAPATDGK